MKLYICLHEGCCRAVKGIRYHLRTHHPETYAAVADDLDDLLPCETDGPDFLPDYHHVRPCPTLPYLPAAWGRVCLHCHFALVESEGQTNKNRAKRARAHLRDAHPSLGVDRWHAYFASVRQPLQSFFHHMNKACVRYFPVGPPLPPGVGPLPFLAEDTGPDDSHTSRFNAFLDTPLPYDPQDDRHNLHPILRRYRFHRYLGSHDRNLIIALAASKVAEDEPESFALLAAIVRTTFQHVWRLASGHEANPGYSRTNMQWIWSFAQDDAVFKDGPPASAFLENIGIDTLGTNYAPTAARLLLVGLRVLRLKNDTSAAGAVALELLPEFPLNRACVVALTDLADLLQARLALSPSVNHEVNPQAMEVVVDALASLLQDSSDASDGTNPNPSLAFRFIALIAAQANDGFAPCSLLTPPTNHLITTCRAIVLWNSVHRPPPPGSGGPRRAGLQATSPQDQLLEAILHHRHHVVLDGRSSPFVFLHSFFNIAKVLAGNEAAFTPHVWTDGNKHTKFTANGVPFDTVEMATELRVMRDETRHLYISEVLRGYPYHELSLAGLVDDPRSVKPGYSFVTDPANKLRVHTQQALRFFESEPERQVPNREHHIPAVVTHCLFR